MEDTPLDIGDEPAGIGLVPAPVQVLRDEAELDQEVAGKVLRFDLAPLFLPEPDQGDLVVPQDDPGI